MKKKIDIVLITVIITITIVFINQIYQDYEKIEFLENKLAQRNLEYEWLSEITDALVNGDSYDFKEKLNEIIEYREKHPEL